MKKIFAFGAALIFMGSVSLANTIVSPVVAIGEKPADITQPMTPGAGDTFCTGTFIAPNIVMTAGHCLTDKKTEVVVRANGEVFIGEVLVDDDLNDYALIETYKSVDIWMPLGCGEPIHLKDRITVTGYPLDVGRITVEGQVIGLASSSEAVNKLWPNGNIILNMLGAPGMSGSAVVNEHGKVVGIFVGGFGNGFATLGLAVPVTPVCAALGNYGT